MAQENLSILEPLVVIAGGKVHSVSNLLDLFKQIAGLIHFACLVLLQADLSHLVNEFGVEKALLARLCLADSGFQGGNTLLIRGLVVERGRTRL